jgi:hypothetical protein
MDDGVAYNSSCCGLCQPPLMTPQSSVSSCESHPVQCVSTTIVMPEAPAPAVGVKHDGNMMGYDYRYNPVMYNPVMYNPVMYNPVMYNPGMYNPGMYNPGMYNPGMSMQRRHAHDTCMLHGCRTQLGCIAEASLLRRPGQLPLTQEPIQPHS